MLESKVINTLLYPVTITTILQCLINNLHSNTGDTLTYTHCTVSVQYVLWCVLL